jgi:hypothetical protein
LKSEGIVRTRFAFLSRFAVKFIEVVGAGLASALCAYFLGHIERPPAPASAVVTVSSANAGGTRMARDDHALLAEVVQKEPESQPQSVAAAPTTVSAPKSAKPAPLALARRQKSDQGSLAETKARSAEPLPIQPHSLASSAAPKMAGQSVQAPVGLDGPAASNSGEEERPLLARLKQIPSWFLPENDRVFGELPRPPMPVGEFVHSAM